jgi:hypothetical protein
MLIPVTSQHIALSLDSIMRKKFHFPKESNLNNFCTLETRMIPRKISDSGKTAESKICGILTLKTTKIFHFYWPFGISNPRYWLAVGLLGKLKVDLAEDSSIIPGSAIEKSVNETRFSEGTFPSIFRGRGCIHRSVTKTTSHSTNKLSNAVPKSLLRCYSFITIHERDRRTDVEDILYLP